ncbi:glycoside hydrolase family 105 protein [Evansella sp. AB-rgal1]|uniref:glycoside hydrolase family 88/105 protein n=1 Tax=Evansella sp. AB-rgal1 TaxID=3242696 RepID=UPI00359E42D3
MESYFHINDSIYSKLQDNVEEVLSIISNRYIGCNPPHPVVYRVFNKDGLTRLKDYRYHFNFGEKFPECKDGQYVYAWGKMWQDKEAQCMFAVNCYGPVHLYVNGDLAYKSTIVEELDPSKKVGFRLTLKKGWNHFVLRFVKTTSGIGGEFGTGSFKRHPMHFLSPTIERDGQEGWIFTEPLDHPLEKIPMETLEQGDTTNWLPETKWTDNTPATQISKIYGYYEKSYALAWAKLNVTNVSHKEVVLKGIANGGMAVFIDDQEVFSTDLSGNVEVKLELSYGKYDIMVKSVCEGSEWGFQLDSNDETVTLEVPHPIKGSDSPWLYVGPFHIDDKIDFSKVKEIEALKDGIEGKTYYRLEQPNTALRPYLENNLFGKWDYPLGVTLYGLIQTGKELNREDIVNYTKNHIETSTSLYQYSLWDKEQYGAAGVNNQLSAIDSLDDCGSFGATMLLSAETETIKDHSIIADDIANHITNIQDRLEDGTLYRRFGSVGFMKDTIWCDDLYMSTPFLCRYYRNTGDISYLDDAVNQFLRYKELMYIPELKIMSHVYDFKFNTATNVPWGRGNGWVIFSLSELLEVLPENHERRPELLTFFRELSEGFLQLQGKNGMWHQVLTDSESYEETSCTSMFIYAYSRGLRFGWLEDKERYIQSVLRGWEGMAKIAIDKLGNVYGVCQGSGYSFTGDYYKNDLTWILNDTHGTGIVLLAGIETAKFKKWLKVKHTENKVGS